jgi:pimeloyl-ACP methyl ester carboxylesterase
MSAFPDRRSFLKTSGATGLVAAGISAPAGTRASRPRRDRIRYRTVRTNGINMHIAEAGTGPTVLLLHGFPESSYSWRRQLPALAAAGFHAVAPDLRGYGRTDAPADAADYSLRENLADLTGLLDALGTSSAAIIGHDQGATFAWAGAQLHPRRFPAVVALGVPYATRLPMPLTQYIRTNNPGKFNVVLYFQRPGVAEAELDADPARTLRMTLYALSGQAPPDLVPRWLNDTPEGAGFLDPLPDPGPPSRWCHWLTDREFGTYTREYERTGFDGAIRRYRTFDFDWADLPQVGTLKVTQPTLYLTGELDSAYRFSSLDPMRANVPGLRKIVVMPGCGHWTQQERSHEVNDHLVDFLRSEYASG